MKTIFAMMTVFSFALTGSVYSANINWGHNDNSGNPQPVQIFTAQDGAAPAAATGIMPRIAASDDQSKISYLYSNSLEGQGAGDVECCHSDSKLHEYTTDHMDNDYYQQIICANFDMQNKRFSEKILFNYGTGYEPNNSASFSVANDKNLNVMIVGNCYYSNGESYYEDISLVNYAQFNLTRYKMNDLYGICVSNDCKVAVTPDGKYVFNVFRDYYSNYFCISFGQIDSASNTINWINNCINVEINNKKVYAQDFRFKLLATDDPDIYRLVIFYRDINNTSYYKLTGTVTVDGAEEPEFSWGKPASLGISPNSCYDMDCSTIMEDGNYTFILVFRYPFPNQDPGNPCPILYLSGTVNDDNSITAHGSIQPLQDNSQNSIMANNSEIQVHMSNDGSKVVMAYTSPDTNNPLKIYAGNLSNYSMSQTSPLSTGFNNASFDTRMSGDGNTITIEGVNSDGSLWYNTGTISW